MGTVGREALDRMLTLGRQQLRSVLAEYVNDCKAHCPHGGLGQALLLGVGEPAGLAPTGRVMRRDRLGGLIHEYAGRMGLDRITGTHAWSTGR